MYRTIKWGFEMRRTAILLAVALAVSLPLAAPAFADKKQPPPPPPPLKYELNQVLVSSY